MRWCLVGALGGALVLARPALALAVERQQHVGVQAGGTVMSTSGAGTPLGWNLGLHYTYGLWDAVNLVVEADGSGFFPGRSPGKLSPPAPAFVGTGGVGAVYVFDVMRLVPYAGGLAGAGYFGGGWLNSGFVTPDVQLAIGLDYQFTRTWTAGVAYRQHFFLAKENTYTEFTTLALRFEYVWGW